MFSGMTDQETGQPIDVEPRDILTMPATYLTARGILRYTEIQRRTNSTAEIGIGPRSEGGFGITAALDVYLPGLPDADAHKLVETTHGICPYSNAIKASLDVKTTTHG